MAEEETPKLHKDRNKILMQYAEQSFSGALDEINSSLKSEKNHSKKLALLSAKSWVLRNKLYVTLNLCVSMLIAEAFDTRLLRF